MPGCCTAYSGTHLAMMYTPEAVDHSPPQARLLQCFYVTSVTRDQLTGAADTYQSEAVSTN